MKSILYLTDLSYQAKGREYFREDLYITGQLRDSFNVAICHPKDSDVFEDKADLIVFRNTGSVIGYKDVYDDFIKRVHEKNLNTFNSFTGKADMCGKQYMIDLMTAGFPVTPTVDRLENISQLGECSRYVIKPKGGADSIGLEFVTKNELLGRKFDSGEMLIQPAVDFLYEVSFYYINNKLIYAMYAPDKNKRWALKRYGPTSEDISFADSFINWNTIYQGIQRVDACRTRDGRLLLVELEDLNPYLSILDLDENTRNKFMSELIAALENSISRKEF
ncbi:MAG TPA: hypothetical protein PLN48_17840 [Lachnospiraceae bacterium]|nr:hypothetical protein [Lachnospiraceae bacterium]